MAPKYLPYFSNSSSNLPGDYTNGSHFTYKYNGFIPEGSSNGISDPNGNLLFFIVDGAIYNGNGDFQEMTYTDDYTLVEHTGSPDGNLTIVYDDNKYHGQETVIVQNPANCRQFYVFGSIVQKNYLEYDPDTHEPVGAIISSRPYYALYDLDQGVLKRGEWYTGAQNTPIVNTNTPIFTNNTQQINGDPVVTDSEWYGQISMRGCLSLAAQKSPSSNETYVSAFLGSELYIIKIKSDGNLSYWKRYSLPSEYQGFSYKRTEMELVWDGTNMKLATELGLTSSIFNTSSDNYLFYMNLSSDMLTLNQSILSPINGDIHGIEFSPDKSLIYYTQSIASLENSNLYYPNIKYYKISDGQHYNFSQNTQTSFKYSYIETGTDGNLYFASINGLHQLTNSNTPNPSNLSSSPTILLSMYSNYSGTPMASNILKSIVLPDQIDDFNYSSINPATYDANSYYVTSSSTWNGTSPIAIGQSEIYIKNELRIKAGVTLTIQNMIIHFAPGARLIVENGVNGAQGGKLILNSTTLTNDNQCDNTIPWLGVEVWGNQNTTQGTINNSTQGVLRILNNSKIELAYIGVLVSRRKEPIGLLQMYSFLDAFNGGIVVAENSELKNNVHGVYFRKYFASNGADNQSYFKKTSLYWNEDHLISEAYGNQLYLISVKGIRIMDCDFRMDDVNNNWKGTGILAYDSKFSVTSLCTSPTLNGCSGSNLLPSRFIALAYGVRTHNYSNNLTYTINKDEFIDCNIGIYSSGAKNAVITSNKFNIREDANTQTVGAALYYCTGYTLQENYFQEYNNTSIPNGTSQSYGLLISTSGTLHNEVYKNTFNNLKIGTQAQGNNGTIYSPINNNASGLQYICNTFNPDIYLTDIGINGRIDYEQGLTGGTSISEAEKRAARNIFSLNGEDPSLNPVHDIKLANGSQYINYVYLGNNNQIPDNYTANGATSVYPHLQTFGGSTVYAGENTCPSKISRVISILNGELAIFKSQIISLNNELDGGHKDLLLDLISSDPDGTLTFDALSDASPYLTDEVLLAYLNSTSNTDNLKTILIANSPLSSTIWDAFNNVGFKQSYIDGIGTYQTDAPSDRTLLYQEIKWTTDNLLNDEYDLYSQYVFDTTDTYNDDSIVALLQSFGNLQSNKILIDIYSEKQNETAFNNLLSSISSELSADFITFTRLKYDIEGYNSIEDAIENEQILNTINNLYTSTNDTEVYAGVDVLYQYIYGLNNIPEFLPLDNQTKNLIISIDEENINSNTNSLLIYPNPSNGQVCFSFLGEIAGEMTIQLYDLSGKLIYSSVTENTTNQLIDLSSINQGTYIARATLNGKQVSKLLLLK